jgi:hypothetical protein
MQVSISPDDDRRADASAPLTPGGQEAGSRVNGFREATKQRSVLGRSDPSPAGVQGVPVRPGTGFACSALPSGRPWSNDAWAALPSLQRFGIAMRYLKSERSMRNLLCMIGRHGVRTGGSLGHGELISLIRDWPASVRRPSRPARRLGTPESQAQLRRPCHKTGHSEYALRS